MQSKLFGRGSGLRVSTLALGTGTFGTRWGYGAEPDAARRIFDAYLDAGDTFIDTADSYQFGEAESHLGTFMGTRRNDIVLATKYTYGVAPTPSAAAVGNSRRVMIQSVDASLQRLKTDRIDLYWVHMPDAVTATDEIMRGLDDLTRAGKIVYAGLSDFPAWRVARAATMAELRGWAPLIGLQMEYSLVERTPDRELVPMAEALGLGVVAWSPLGGGLLTGKYRKGESGRASTWKNLIHAEDGPTKTAILDALQSVAEELGSNPARVAIAWVAAKGMVPILGPRTPEQLADNLGAVELALTPDQILRLDAASAVPLGFPHEMLNNERNRTRLAGGSLDASATSRLPIA